MLSIEKDDRICEAVLVHLYSIQTEQCCLDCLHRVCFAQYDQCFIKGTFRDTLAPRSKVRISEEREEGGGGDPAYCLLVYR